MTFLKLHKWWCGHMCGWYIYRSRCFRDREVDLRAKAETADYESIQSARRARFWRDEEHRINLYICALPDRNEEAPCE